MWGFAITVSHVFHEWIAFKSNQKWNEKKWNETKGRDYRKKMSYLIKLNTFHILLIYNEKMGSIETLT